jgi:3-dehydroquinate dehydratase-1
MPKSLKRIAGMKIPAAGFTVAEPLLSLAARGTAPSAQAIFNYDGERVKPTVEAPIQVRGVGFGGDKPLFCIPLVAAEPAELTAQADIAHRLRPDLVEWRADFSHDWSPEGLVSTAKLLRQALPEEPIIFTLRVAGEGGAQPMPQTARKAAIEAILRSGCVDLLDLELANEPEFLRPLMSLAKEHGVPVILAFHDFQGTPSTEELLAKIALMRETGADIAKLAVMPRTDGDVLRLLQVTATARNLHPALPLSIMSMGALGSITRVAGFLYGSDMAFAVGKQASAPGQIPIEDARLMTTLLLRYGSA